MKTARELDDAKVRVEELEKFIEGEKPWVLNGHFFTTEKIDAAWDLWSRRGGVWRDFMTEVFAIFNIVRCETCKGTGQTLTRVNVTSLWKRECPVCEGHGWRKDK